MANIREKVISILARNSNLGHSYLITTVLVRVESRSTQYSRVSACAQYQYIGCCRAGKVFRDESESMSMLLRSSLAMEWWCIELVSFVASNDLEQSGHTQSGIWPDRHACPALACRRRRHPPPADTAADTTAADTRRTTTSSRFCCAARRTPPPCYCAQVLCSLKPRTWFGLLNNVAADSVQIQHET